MSLVAGSPGPDWPGPDWPGPARPACRPGLLCQAQQRSLRLALLWPFQLWLDRAA